MINKKNTERVDQAWDNLFRRLEKDGLLPVKDKTVSLKKRNINLYRWASAIIILCLSTILIAVISDSRKSDSQHYSSITNDSPINLVTTLEDGSLVYLTEAASLSFPEHFEDFKREVRLDGEAFFDISKQDEKPFVIETERVQIEVLGTAFNVVNREGAPFSLSVLRGAVRVVNKKDGSRKIVEAGKSVRIDNNTIESLIEFDIQQFDKYSGNLYFKDERLENIVRVINRTSDSLKVVLNPELNGRLLTGTFDNKETLSMVELVCMALDLRYKQENGTIEIFSATN